MALTRHVITLMGQPNQDEQGKATEAITPGQLVQGTTSIARHATAGGKTVVKVALERQEMGQGIDVPYAAGDQVKTASYAGGDRFYGFCKAGANIAAEARLESAGDGSFQAVSTGTDLVKALEAVNNTAGGVQARIRLEVL